MGRMAMLQRRVAIVQATRRTKLLPSPWRPGGLGRGRRWFPSGEFPRLLEYGKGAELVELEGSAESKYKRGVSLKA